MAHNLFHLSQKLLLHSSRHRHSIAPRAKVCFRHWAQLNTLQPPRAERSTSSPCLPTELQMAPMDSYSFPVFQSCSVSLLWWENSTQLSSARQGSRRACAAPRTPVASNLPSYTWIQTLLSLTGPGAPSHRDLCDSEYMRGRGKAREYECLLDRYSEAQARALQGKTRSTWRG